MKAYAEVDSPGSYLWGFQYCFVRWWLCDNDNDEKKEEKEEKEEKDDEDGDRDDR